MTTATSSSSTAPATYASLRKRQQVFVDALINCGYSGATCTRRAVVTTAAHLGYPDSFPWPSWLTADLTRRLARGVFSLPELAERVTERGHSGSLPAGYALDPNQPGTMCHAPAPSHSA